MRNTIKSSNGGYSVETYIGKKTGKTFGKVYDGDTHLFTGEVRTMADYKEEKEGNECFTKYEVFTTTDGKQFIYWGDWEINADYITPVQA